MRALTATLSLHIGLINRDSDTTVETKRHYKHLRNLEKSLRMIERLHFETALKSTLSGSEFHTLTTRSLKKAALTRDTVHYDFCIICTDVL